MEENNSRNPGYYVFRTILRYSLALLTEMHENTYSAVDRE
jgi:hypothetical protein